MRTLVVHLSGHDPLISQLKKALEPLEGTEGPGLATFDSVDRMLTQADDVELVLVCLNGNPDRGLETIRRLRGWYAGKILAVGPVRDSKLILRALDCGADHYHDQAEIDVDLDRSIDRLIAKPENGAAQGRLLAVLSASGGCGASTIAVNIAAMLAKERGECGLIDLNPGRGDLAALLDLKPAFTLTDLCMNEARLDRAMFEKMLARHASGIRLLAAPVQFSDSRIVTARGVGQALTWARRQFAEVVVDLEDCFHDEQVLALQQAAGLLLVCRLDFTSLRNTRRMLDHIAKLEVPRSHVKLVINHAGQTNELPVDEAERALGEKLSWFVPHDPKTICAANNTGIPAVLKDPSAKVTQALLQLARINFEKPASTAKLPRPATR